MKLTITLLLAIFSLSFYAQSSSFSQKTLITKRTATWCPNCGTWGWSFAKAIDELENENAILIRAHYSGDLQSQVAKDITENFKAVYQPEFYINEEIQSVGSTTWQDKVADFEEAVNENASSNVDVSTSITSSIEGEAITIEVSATLLNDLEGDYFLAAYLLENEVVNNQAALGNSIHNRVLRASFTEDSFGEQMIESSGSKGTAFAYNSMLTPNGGPVADRQFEILVIVWMKEGEQYKVENVHVSEIGGITNIESLLFDNDEFNVFQSGANLVLNFQNNRLSTSTSSLDIYSIGGKKIFSKQIMINKGGNYIEMPIPSLLKQQVYMLRVGPYSSKILIRN